MKNSSIRLIIWSVIALALLALMGILFFRPSLLSGVSLNFPNLTTITYDNSGRYSAGEGSAKNISKLDIEWVDGRIELIPYDGKEVVFEESSNQTLSEEERLHWYVDDGRLMIKYAKSGVGIGVNLDKHLTVKLPADVRYEDIELEAVSTEVKISGLIADEVRVDTVSGSVVCDGLEGRELDIDSVSGALKLSGLDFAKLDMESVSGSVQAEFTKKAEPEQINANSTSGSVTLILPEKLGFEAQFETVSGTISNDFPAITSKNSIVCGDGRAKIDVETVSGSLSVEMLK